MSLPVDKGGSDVYRKMPLMSTLTGHTFILPKSTVNCPTCPSLHKSQISSSLLHSAIGCQHLGGKLKRFLNRNKLHSHQNQLPLDHQGKPKRLQYSTGGKKSAQLSSPTQAQIVKCIRNGYINSSGHNACCFNICIFALNIPI